MMRVGGFGEHTGALSAVENDRSGPSWLSWIVAPLIAVTAATLVTGCTSIQQATPSKLLQIAQQQPVLFMEDGGWCWFQDPRAMIVDGKLIIGGISGKSGDIRVGAYDLETNKLLGAAVLDPGFERDDHNSPVFHLRNDGRILAMWAEHGKENRHYFSLSEPGDPLQWSPRQTHEHPFEIPADQPWGGVTYTNLYRAGPQGTLYNAFRLGLDLNPYVMTSNDDGATWQGFTHFLADEVPGTHRPYTRFVQKDVMTIGVAFTDAHPRDYGNSLYYAVFDGSDFLDAAGRRVADLTSGPLPTSKAEKVFEGSETLAKPEGYGSVPNAAWTIDLEVNASGQPAIGYSLYLGDFDQRYRLANWDGKAWNDREIAFAGTHLYPREASYTGLLALDPDDPELVAISSDVDPATGKDNGGQYEIYWARVGAEDHTETIDWVPLTQGSQHKNIRPIIVTGEGYKVLLWMTGPWSHFEDYDSDIVGHVLQRPGQGSTE